MLPSQLSDGIKTTSGIIHGKTHDKLPAVEEYLGIRFGQTTGGQNRWLPPKKYVGNDTITATKFGAGCPQGMPLLNAISGLLGSNESEDCLFINVWVKGADASKKRPVMLSIYGGAFALGDSSMAVLNGAQMTNNHDVLVVSMNYRVNAFGFPGGAPGLMDLNPGLLDQRLAVEWTRDNIAAFGGDPSRIILFGESAGASSVDYHAYAWAKDPIVAGYITESGTAMMNDLFKPANSKADTWFAMSKKLGCGGPEAGEKSLQCARGKSVYEVVSAFPSPGGSGFKSIVPVWKPTADERTVFSDVFERAKSGNFALKVFRNKSET